MRQPMLDPKRDLAGATPETLTRALFRRVEPYRRDKLSDGSGAQSSGGKEVMPNGPKPSSQSATHG